jgi:trehalose/maltose hydrolase-like predicted phosphorylase
MAGSINFMIFQLCGLQSTKEALSLHPALPHDLQKVEFKFAYRHHWMQVCITKDRCVLEVENDGDDTFQVIINGKKYQVSAGYRISHDLSIHEHHPLPGHYQEHAPHSREQHHLHDFPTTPTSTSS